MDTKQAALVSVYNTPGYEIILKYFEEGCKNAEADLLNTDPSETNNVLVRHYQTTAAWKLFLEVKERIRRDVLAATQPEVKPLTEKEEGELYIQNLN